MFRDFFCSFSCNTVASLVLRKGTPTTEVHLEVDWRYAFESAAAPLLIIVWSAASIWFMVWLFFYTEMPERSPIEDIERWLTSRSDTELILFARRAVVIVFIFVLSVIVTMLFEPRLIAATISFWIIMGFLWLVGEP